MDPGRALASNGKEVVGQSWYDSMEIVGHLHAVGRVRCAVSAVLKARGVPAPAPAPAGCCWLLLVAVLLVCPVSSVAGALQRGPCYGHVPYRRGQKRMGSTEGEWTALGLVAKKTKSMAHIWHFNRGQSDLDLPVFVD
jgi:hypothetical protein